MTLHDYWKSYRATWAHPVSEGIAEVPTTLAPYVAAGFQAGLTPEQLLRFHTQFLRVRQVVAVLARDYELTPEKTQEILDAYSSGLIYAKDVVRRLFTPEQVHADYRGGIFNTTAGD